MRPLTLENMEVDMNESKKKLICYAQETASRKAKAARYLAGKYSNTEHKKAVIRAQEIASRHSFDARLYMGIESYS